MYGENKKIKKINYLISLLQKKKLKKKKKKEKNMIILFSTVENDLSLK